MDSADHALQEAVHLDVLVTNTMMRSLDDKMALAQQCMTFCGRLRDKQSTGLRASP